MLPSSKDPMTSTSSIAAVVSIMLFTLTQCSVPAQARTLTSEEAEALPNSFPAKLVPPDDPALRRFIPLLLDHEFPSGLGKIASFMLYISHFQVPFVVKQCGRSDSFYSPSKAHIVVCYEAIVETNQLLGRPQSEWYAYDSKTASVMAYIGLHEIGHALMDKLHIKRDKREEDMADEFAYLILASVDKGMSRRILENPYVYYHRHSVEVEGKLGHSADDPHSPSEVRSVVAMCVLYGMHRDPEIGRRLGRAARSCIEATDAAIDDWNARLAPYSRITSRRTFDHWKP